MWLLSPVLFAQQLKITPDEEIQRTKWMILQKLEGGEMFYLMAVDSIPSGGAVFPLKGLPYGEYAVQYDTDHLPGVRFIHSGEDVEIKFQPRRPAKPEIIRSYSNKTYYDWITYNRRTIARLRQLKKQYARQASPQLQEKFTRLKQTYNRHYDSLLKANEGKLVWHFIKGKKEVFPDRLKESKQAYIDYALAHYFDEIDLNDSILYNSHVLYDRLEEYLFRIPYGVYGKKRSDAYIKRLKNIFGRMHYLPSRASFIKTFIVLFSMEDATARKYMEKLYKELPLAFQSKDFIAQIEKNKMAVRGERFDAEFLKKYTGKNFTFNDLNLIIFYSSDCPHCQRQLPEVYKYLEKKKPYKHLNVLAVGLEENPENWKVFTAPFTKWKNAYITGEKMMDVVMKFGIEFTPTFFVTDKDGVILEKTTGGNEIYKILDYFLNHETENKRK